MTLTELKSLQVGQVVKYTNDVDAFNVEYWKVTHNNDYAINLSNIRHTDGQAIHFNDPDIDHIASMLTIDQPIAYKALEPQRQLKLIEAKIRDAEFDVTTKNGLGYYNYAELLELRQQRNELIEKI
jgi:hypothetical protein